MSHLTEREKQILAYLKKDPMISQDELAAKMQISRSAAAVHISNLMRKGYILGRGYIFNERSGVLVIGKTWIEIRGEITGEAPAGKVVMEYGGFGYLLAQELARFRVEPTLLTFLGRDEIGDQIYNNLLQKGVKVQHIIRNPAFSSGKRIVVKRGEELLLEVEEMDIARSLTQKVLSTKEELLRTTKVLLIDGTLPFQEIEYLITKIKQYNIAASIVGCSLNWLQKKELLSCPQLFLVCRHQEIQELEGVPLGTEPEAFFPSCRRIINQGLQALIVILEEQGLLLVTKKETMYFPVLPLHTSGSPLSITAGIAGGLAAGYEIRLAVRRAMGIQDSQQPGRSRSQKERTPGSLEFDESSLK
ncbi:MAG: winged helix-turn-helix transcriptional regulator [Firmicutes bacterium]|nr:winged helix-turn-helix transcriptional regulator [Bacillota bacterium]